MIEMIVDIFSMLVMITLILWIPKFVLLCLPKNKKHNNLIKQLEKINDVMKSVWFYVWMICKMVITAIVAAFIGINSRPIIYKLNYALGEGYALWASYIITGLIFYALYGNVRNIKSKRTKSKGGKK